MPGVCIVVWGALLICRRVFERLGVSVKICCSRRSFGIGAITQSVARVCRIAIGLAPASGAIRWASLITAARGGVVASPSFECFDLLQKENVSGLLRGLFNIMQS